MEAKDLQHTCFSAQLHVNRENPFLWNHRTDVATLVQRWLHQLHHLNALIVEFWLPFTQPGESSGTGICFGCLHTVHSSIRASASQP